LRHCFVVVDLHGKKVGSKRTQNVNIGGLHDARPSDAGRVMEKIIIIPMILQGGTDFHVVLPGHTVSVRSIPG
jgi:hypothetical protein